MNEESVIHFFYEDCGEFKLTDPEKVADWLKQIVDSNRCSLASLNYIFCNDEYLHEINLNYLQHDTYTDIITFDNSEEASVIEGDIYVSVDRIQENALLHNTTFFSELHRVIAHGALHLIGYNDKSEEEKLEMRKKEEACLSLYPDK